MDPNTGLFSITHSTHQAQRNAKVVSVDRIVRGCHLMARCGQNILSTWTTDNILKQSSIHYLVNPYINVVSCTIFLLRNSIQFHPILRNSALNSDLKTRNLTPKFRTPLRNLTPKFRAKFCPGTPTSRSKIPFSFTKSISALSLFFRHSFLFLPVLLDFHCMIIYPFRGLLLFLLPLFLIVQVILSQPFSTMFCQILFLPLFVIF